MGWQEWLLDGEVGHGETSGGQILSREADVWGKKAVAALNRRWWGKEELMEVKICVCVQVLPRCSRRRFWLFSYLLMCGTELHCSVQGIFMMHFKVTSRALRAYG